MWRPKVWGGAGEEVAWEGWQGRRLEGVVRGQGEVGADGAVGEEHGAAVEVVEAVRLRGRSLHRRVRLSLRPEGGRGRRGVAGVWCWHGRGPRMAPGIRCAGGGRGAGGGGWRGLVPSRGGAGSARWRWTPARFAGRRHASGGLACGGGPRRRRVRVLHAKDAIAMEAVWIWGNATGFGWRRRQDERTRGGTAAECQHTPHANRGPRRGLSLEFLSFSFLFSKCSVSLFLLLFKALFRYNQKNPKTLQDFPSHRILRHMHGTLNVDKKDN